MNEINRQVARARRRLNTGLFFGTLAWTLFVGLFVAAMAWAVPKIWSLEPMIAAAQLPTWYVGWFSGGSLLGFIVALVRMFYRGQSPVSAAMEVDSRFGLKERLSSALVLSSTDAESAAGRALLSDASERAARIDVRDQFPFHLSNRAWLPAIPAALLVALWFVPDAPPKLVVETNPVVNERKLIESKVEEAKKAIEEKVKQLEEKGLIDAVADLKTLAKSLDDLKSDNADLKKDALVKLNNLRDVLEKQRAEIGDAAAMKQNLERLKDAAQGPAQKLAEAMADGDFEMAKKIVKDLAAKLKAGKLTELEKKNLAKDLQNLAEQAQKMIADHEQAKQDLQEQIKQAQAQGDLQKAADLQEKLEKKQAIDKQIEKMKQAAENMKKCADCIGNKEGAGAKQNNQPQPNKNGDQKKGGGSEGKQGDQKSKTGEGQPSDADMKKAQQALEDLAEQMDQMEMDQDMMEQLKDLEDDLQECKDGMNNCENPGDKPNNKPDWGDWGKGNGRGHGKRDLKENETGEFKSKVKAQLQKGETVATGDADGNNIPGSSIADARELVKAEMAEQTDPLEDQQLPKAQRDQAKQYFEKLRGGK